MVIVMELMTNLIKMIIMGKIIREVLVVLRKDKMNIKENYK